MVCVGLGLLTGEHLLSRILLEIRDHRRGDLGARLRVSEGRPRREEDLLLGELVVDVGAVVAMAPEQQRSSHEQDNHEGQTDGAGQNVEDSATHHTAPIGRDDPRGPCWSRARRPRIGAGDALARRRLRRRHEGLYTARCPGPPRATPRRCHQPSAEVPRRLRDRRTTTAQRAAAPNGWWPVFGVSPDPCELDRYDEEPCDRREVATGRSPHGPTPERSLRRGGVSNRNGSRRCGGDGSGRYGCRSAWGGVCGRRRPLSRGR